MEVIASIFKVKLILKSRREVFKSVPWDSLLPVSSQARRGILEAPGKHSLTLLPPAEHAEVENVRVNRAEKGFLFRMALPLI